MNFKTFSSFLLTILWMATLISAAVKILSKTEEEDAIRLWHKFCTGDSDHGSDGNTFVFCKRAKENLEDTLEHTVDFNPPAEVSRQVVFVQPPSHHYRHNVVVNGKTLATQNTTIYVLPQIAHHNILFNDSRKSISTPAKPILYFLNKDPSAGDSDQLGGSGVAIKSKSDLVHLTDSNHSGSSQTPGSNDEFIHVK